MSFKLKTKRVIPSSLLPYAKKIYGYSKVPHYWIPYAFKKGIAWNPKSITLEVTYRCNLKCAMCPQAIDYKNKESKLKLQQKQQRELNVEEIYKLINDACELGVNDFNLTGGEVFMRNDIFQIINYIKNKNSICSILTNGTLITKEAAKKVVNLGVDKMTFSLDGPKEIHNDIRQNPNAFDKLLEAIRFIQEEKIIQKKSNPYLALSCTISALNHRYLSELVDIAGEYNININFGYLFYSTQEMEAMTEFLFSTNGVKGEDQDVPPYLKDVDPQVIQSEISLSHKKAKKYDIAINFQPNFRGQEIQKRFNDDAFSYVNKCFYPWYSLRVNPYGDVYPCSMNVHIGNIKNEHLKSLWNNKQYVRFRKTLMKNGLFPKCTKCCALNNKLWSYLPCIIKP